MEEAATVPAPSLRVTAEEVVSDADSTNYEAQEDTNSANWEVVSDQSFADLSVASSQDPEQLLEEVHYVPRMYITAEQHGPCSAGAFVNDTTVVQRLPTRVCS